MTRLPTAETSLPLVYVIMLVYPEWEVDAHAHRKVLEAWDRLPSVWAQRDEQKGCSYVTVAAKSERPGIAADAVFE